MHKSLGGYMTIVKTDVYINIYYVSVALRNHGKAKSYTLRKAHLGITRAAGWCSGAYLSTMAETRR